MRQGLVKETFTSEVYILSYRKQKKTTKICFNSQAVKALNPSLNRYCVRWSELMTLSPELFMILNN